MAPTSFSPMTVPLFLVVLVVWYNPASAFHSTVTSASSSLRRRHLDNDIISLPSRLLPFKTKAADEDTATEPIIGTVALLVPSSSMTISKFGSKSPISPPSYIEVAQQLVRKIRHFSDGRIIATIISPDDDTTSSSLAISSDALFAIGLTSPSDIQYLSRTFRERRTLGRRSSCQFAIDCGTNRYEPIVGPYDAANPSPIASLAPWSDVASGKRLMAQMSRLFDEYSTDEFALATMLHFNQFSGHKVPWVEHTIDVTWEKGPIRNAKELAGMISKCGPCIATCLSDDNCSACIKALDKIDTRDQVSSYRTIVSYESKLLQDFTLCILTKNDVFGCRAIIPTLPQVIPTTTWRGREMTTELSRQILIGHLSGVAEESSPEGSRQLDVSWKVSCGANAAYDQFPSQNQLFYPTAGSGSKDLWYDPVFRVETLDGRNVWCKRHYRVRCGKVPGTFRFTVLDNGVTSDEFWTIIGAADDLSWVLFHYAGAAAAVGQRYIGGLLCTPDGSLPPPEDLNEIWRIFRSAEIEPWELFVVDNDETTPGALAAGPPPLNYYRTTVEAKREPLAAIIS